jgi:hypothetical protein
VIDDFMVEDDPGYGYDTYEGRPISLALLKVPDQVTAADPAAPSTVESGERRARSISVTESELLKRWTPWLPRVCSGLPNIATVLLERIMTGRDVRRRRGRQ